MAKAIRETLKSTKARSKSMANVSAMSPIKQKPYLEAWKHRLQKPIANVFGEELFVALLETSTFGSPGGGKESVYRLYLVTTVYYFARI